MCISNPVNSIYTFQDKWMTKLGPEVIAVLQLIVDVWVSDGLI